ncbi:formylglycine-generating enzyme family protein [Sphingomonas sp.]|uniref:formylglycine-generating enzyme family protein n=1 Tax=Sphingomonas sp. TaxID=28214 RepID=UPI000DB03BC0|nr:formylglycine-generating enzyme family protein [Sphingomonas sp.]PZU06780.1 MAG: gliding motility-associated lipoprotein GldK [Sphingomonas sp.]
MITVPGSEYRMGSDSFYPEEQPVRRVKIDTFLIDEYPVTNADFAAFVAATGYVTSAERSSDDGVVGSAVFHRTREPVPCDDPRRWWAIDPDANWRRPEGMGSSVDGREDHPVVHVTSSDAEAYATWAGNKLPTEAEWELAARGGLDGSDYAWGDELAPGGRMLANYWQGLFPFSNLLTDGWERTSPVGSFPPNGYGIFDMIGNVWEWTADWWALPQQIARSCCSVDNPRGGRRHDSFEPGVRKGTGRRVLKGGSHLCAANYCQRYRPAARIPQAIDSSTGHIGFRCVMRPPRS